VSFALAALIPLAFIVVFVAIIVFVRRREKQRSAALKDTAFRQGWTEREVPDGPPQGLETLYLFGQGRGGKVQHFFEGSPGSYDALLFEYEFTTGSGRNSSTHRQTVVAFTFPETSLPAFELRPETMFHRWGGVFGYHDIDFADRPEFSNAYVLHGEDGGDDTAVRQHFTHEVTGYLERNLGWAIEAAGDRLMVYRPDNRVKPEDLHTFFTACEEVATVVGRPKSGWD
jgi:hypothetical protein